MTEKLEIKAVDRVEILTLQDNTIDLVQQDNNAVVQRAMPLVGLEVKNSILAEHGFSSLITVTDDDRSRCMLFDFGFSEQGAAQNADALGADLTAVEATALSHGHLDHVGGIGPLIEKTGKRDIPLVVHPAAFRNPRFMKISDDFKVFFPAFTRDKAAAAGAAVVDVDRPYPMLDHTAAFLGQIPRTTGFEKGAPNLFCEIDGLERQDPFDDDSAMVFNVRGKGLVVVSGCAHSGIVNTVAYARQATGVDPVMAVMGGFHLAGQDPDRVVAPTIDALKAIAPTYIIPTHCTGRLAIQRIEKEMPDQFILNMSGTHLTFSA
ncbi:MBL fold metallo-hydrolase [Desulfosarcina alkanivorans]|uniref:MBL fold metallo-hydrolase n=1 Tax=Desulfosarcina alkanivorans TaxID=571177 RepID=A0A5K7YTX6_9BACT|nr:MBL fold metallo-hydrolase [Desulfosarcina alkanivorans]BBO68127.1 MBL fold metallo-hydrolase [Desulfosarcina alkanivorans]